jgi:hypothetical protein
VNVTPAYLFRKVGDDDGGRPTILYDEVDTLFGSKIQDSGEIRGLLNAGHRRGAVAGRCIMIGKKVETEEIPAYCAVALAGLGDLPDTIASRSILIEMRRRAFDEPVEPFRRRLQWPEAEKIRHRLSHWCDLVAPSLLGAQPAMPSGVVDRDADCWEPLLAIADAAGEDWPERARNAAKALVGIAAETTQTTGVQLLGDLYDIFGDAEKLPTQEILHRLRELPESPWLNVQGNALNDRGLATRLRKYGVKPKAVRISDQILRGYLATDLHDPWKRYVLPLRQEAHQAQQEQRHIGGPPNPGETGTDVAAVADVAPFRRTDVRCDAYELEERAAILEFDGGLNRAAADARALEEMPDLPEFLKRK